MIQSQFFQIPIRLVKVSCFVGPPVQNQTFKSSKVDKSRNYLHPTICSQFIFFLLDKWVSVLSLVDVYSFLLQIFSMGWVQVSNIFSSLNITSCFCVSSLRNLLNTKRWSTMSYWLKKVSFPVTAIHLYAQVISILHLVFKDFISLQSSLRMDLVTPHFTIVSSLKSKERTAVTVWTTPPRK